MVLPSSHLDPSQGLTPPPLLPSLMRFDVSTAAIAGSFVAQANGRS